MLLYQPISIDTHTAKVSQYRNTPSFTLVDPVSNPNSVGPVHQLSAMTLVMPEIASAHRVPFNSTHSHAALLSSHDGSSLWMALMLTSLAGFATTIGAFIVIFEQQLSWKRLGFWQGLAAGFMLCVSFFNLIPEIVSQSNSKPLDLLLFILGSILFLLLQKYLPDPSFFTNNNSLIRIPSHSNDSSLDSTHSLSDVLYSGILTALVLAAHNLPEGIAVCISSLNSTKLGIPLAISIGLHNIPEGMAVAIPVYFTTRKVSSAVFIAFLSGLAEPLGVFVVVVSSFLFQTDSFNTLALLTNMLAFVAGIMVTISLAELYPLAIKYAGLKSATFAVAVGFLSMSIILAIIDYLHVGM